MAKFECPSCGYLLVDASSCSECGKSVRQSVADWRDRSDALRWTAFGLTGLLILWLSATHLIRPVLALIKDSSYIDFYFWRMRLFFTVQVAVLAWPAWRAMVAGRNRLPLWRVTAAIPLSAVATGLLIVLIWVLVIFIDQSEQVSKHGNGRPSVGFALGMSLLGLITPLLAGWLATGLVCRVTRVASWQAALSPIREPESGTPAVPAAASAEQAKPGESGESA